MSFLKMALCDNLTRSLLPLLALSFPLCSAAFCATNEDGGGRESILVIPPDVQQQRNSSLSWTDFELSQLHTISGSKVYAAATINFISAVFHGSNSSCGDVIGVVGDLDSQTASIIHTLASRAGLNITLVATSTPSTFLPVTNLHLPHLLDMNPLQHYVNALVNFLEQLNWNRIGLITDNTNYYIFATELLQKKLMNSGITVTPYVRITKTNLNKPDNILGKFEEYGTKIIVVLVSDDLKCSVLSKIIEFGYTWPKYAIIVLDLEPLLQSTRKCHLHDGTMTLASDIQQSTFSDSILATLMNFYFANAPFQEELAFRNGSLLTNVSFAQVQNGTDSLIAVYNSELQELMFSPYKLLGDEIPQGIFRIVEHRSSALHITLVLIVSVLCFGFITVNLVLYIVFRNEPEVKATSVSVSMCMFLGCYLLILFNVMLLLELQPIWNTKASRTFICTTLVALSAFGLSFGLIFATLIVKMLRVYVIFSKPHSYKKKLFSNPALLSYIIMFMCPIVFLLFVSLPIDEFTKVAATNEMKSHTVVFARCVNKHTILWILTFLAYNAVMIFVLVTLAVKSSKIRFKYFNDTKATNAFTYLSIYVSLMTIVNWYFFHSMPISTGNTDKKAISLYIGHTAEALLCQICLFVPKVYPPTARKVRHLIWHH